MLDFSGQKLLFIGGSSGIGYATAQLAAALGGQVTIASRSAERVARAAEAVGSGADGRVIDVTNNESVDTFFADGVMWDHVIVTGSQTSIAPVRKVSVQSAQAAFDSKFWGFYRVARVANIRPRGSLSVIAGFLATRPSAERALMGAINAALENLVKGLALELKPVRVNAVSPAVVNTEMWAGMPAEQREATFTKLAASYPAGRIGQPEDIARQLLLLAGTEYATGTIVTLDGGASIA
jgi:NAD(P)-dependent dehydrogenase (short-subunit alcohol dehydrogenase family)